MRHKEIFLWRHIPGQRLKRVYSAADGRSRLRLHHLHSSSLDFILAVILTVVSDLQYRAPLERLPSMAMPRGHGADQPLSLFL